MTYEIEPADDIQQFTSFASAIDLTSTTYPAAKARGHARRIIVNDITAGAILEVQLTGSAGTARALTVAAGDVYDGKFVGITTNTTVSRLTVLW
jgi:hypothetical protein